MSDRIAIFDTTLRDGEQSPGCSMHTPEKVRMALQLERLGVDIIEAGFPIASPGDFEAVESIAGELKTAKVAGLCRAKAVDIEAAGKALKGAAHPVIHTFLASSGIHLQWKLKISPEEAIKQAVEGIKLARTFVDDVEFSAEDASRTDYEFLKRDAAGLLRGRSEDPERPRHRRLLAARRSTGRWSRSSSKDIPGAIISVHCHNDLGLAVANSLAAVEAGARQVECTINGIGERAGNASLEEFVMALKVRREALNLETGIKTELLTPDQQPPLDGDRGVAPAEQGHRGTQRLRPRGGHPPARHARQPALLRDHDPRERRARRVDARSSASTPASTRSRPGSSSSE